MPHEPPHELRPEDWNTILWSIMAITCMCLVGIYVLSKFRGVKGEADKTASESLTKFREMHSRGELSDEEYRTIKAKLTEELRRGLKDSEEPG